MSSITFAASTTGFSPLIPFSEKKNTEKDDLTNPEVLNFQENFSERLRAYLISEECIDAHGTLKKKLKPESFPYFSLEILSHLAKFLTEVRHIKESDVTFTLAEFLQYLDVQEAKEIKIIGSQVLWRLSLEKTDDAYLRMILETLGAKVPGRCLFGRHSAAI